MNRLDVENDLRRGKISARNLCVGGTDTDREARRLVAQEDAVALRRLAADLDHAGLQAQRLAARRARLV